VLLEGTSGSGKSTLGQVITGNRAPDGGLLRTRERTVLVPQFHDNHVFNASFAFNLLMGRAWPPGPEDWRKAEEVCRDAGLGPLLDKMPAGLGQMLGESGWQLSHGERSRLYLARALLQEPDFIVLDESLSALDPETLRETMACLTRRAATLMVIAHP
jgi:ATP-binding cassette subfamily B protein